MDSQARRQGELGSWGEPARHGAPDLHRLHGGYNAITLRRFKVRSAVRAGFHLVRDKTDSRAA